MSIKELLQKKWLLYTAVILWWLVQLAITLQVNVAVAAAKYHISTAQLHAIQVVFSFPTLFIWLALCYAIICFMRYIVSIGDAAERPAFKAFLVALAVILVSSILTSVLSTSQDLYAAGDSNISLRNTFLVTINYINVILSLVSYWLLYRGSSQLLQLTNKGALARKNTRRLLLPVLAIGAAYIALILSNPNRRVSMLPDMPPVYALSDPLIIGTIALPYILAWFFGLAAMTNMHSFYHNAKGVVYRLLFRNLYIGLSMMIVLTIGIQFLSQFGSYLQSLGFGSVLVLVTVLILILIYAFLEVARGARRLLKLENLGSGGA